VRRVLELGLALLALSAALCACDEGGTGLSRVNGSVHVAAGTPPDVAESVNGSVHVDANATVTVAKTVNGGIKLGPHASADAADTVNGSIVLEDGAHVSGTVETVNGSITLNDGADVGGSVENVNGGIKLSAAHVGGRIKTTNGGIEVLGSSHVEHGILMEKPGSGFFSVSRLPRVVIGPGAAVDGELRFEREVRLYVSDRAKVGPVIGATATPFSGDTAPD
jgi:DUF4097 and DUF4098 domain-containing protein YvlB